MTIEIREVDGFVFVELRGPGTLKITQGNSESLVVHAPEYMLGDIESSVRNERLMLGYRSPKVVTLKSRQEIISYHLTMTEIRGICHHGSGKIVAPDIDADHFSVLVTGSGLVAVAELTADVLESKITGAGRVIVAGDVESQYLNLSGSGSYVTRNLVSDFGSLRISGSGDANVSVSDQLDVVITGSGKVSYSGHPEIRKQIYGSGKISRIRRA